jgi:hypothetical protein
MSFLVPSRAITCRLVHHPLALYLSHPRSFKCPFGLITVNSSESPHLGRHLCLVNDLPPPSQMSKTITFSVKREEETPPLSPMLGDTAIPVGHYLSILPPRFTVLPARHDQW